ncbi:hypothetical protein [Parapedobacter koreensis]|uniref:Uncharacterized protein n=1 Tax=Parapedobacter koreensis TaxID=332977 RepID=A0A1H7PZJ0_9SPHI|nr:hypothetical protein [Parapedobacter koreensis]SEL40969.1 hypothetical protein SAMN05421740_10587 [Parapedobacter koreensis]
MVRPKRFSTNILSIIFFTQFCYKTSNAQINPTQISSRIDSLIFLHLKSSQQADDLLIERKNDDKTFTRPTYKKYIEEKLTYLTYDRGTFPIGTSASLNIKENQTILDLSIARKFQNEDILKRLLVLSFGLQSTFGNGVSNLFSGSDVNSGTVFSLSFALFPRTATYKKVLSGFTPPHGEFKKARYDLFTDRLAKFKNDFFHQHTESLPQKYHAALLRWIDINKTLIRFTNKSDYTLIKEKEEIETFFKSHQLLDSTASHISKTTYNKFLNELYKLEIENPTWEWEKLTWFSGGITYRQTAYSTFDGSLLIEKQFDEQRASLISGTITINHYKERVWEDGLFRTQYFNFSYQPNVTNNYEKLRNQTFESGTLKDSVIGKITFLQNEYTAKDVTGIEYKTRVDHTLSGNYTAMLGEKKAFGGNIIAKATFSPISKPEYHLHFGSIIRFINNKYDPTEKISEAKVNIEVFLELPDLIDSRGSNTGGWKRRIIGVNTSIPFKRLLFK